MFIYSYSPLGHKIKHAAIKTYSIELTTKIQFKFNYFLESQMPQKIKQDVTITFYFLWNKSTTSNCALLDLINIGNIDQTANTASNLTTYSKFSVYVNKFLT